MTNKQTTRGLRDISNLMDPPLTDQLHHSNVFKRLSTSPSKKYPNDLSKPAVRLSPVRKSPSKSAAQLTPKRLASPDCLKNYVSKITQSMDRPFFERHGGDQRLEDSGCVTNLVFPSSPTKMTFSNDKKIGGDGSLSKLRSRFSNGLLSPQRMASMADTNLPSTELRGRNLFSKLEEDDRLGLHYNDHSSRVKKKIHAGTSFQDGTRILKTRQPKKRVKFQLPQSNEEKDIKDQLENLNSILAEVLERQKQLEDRLMKVEDSQHRHNT